MDSSESKDGIEAGTNSPSRPLLFGAQSPRRKLGRVSPARRLTMSRGELNRERDDASASGGGADAAPRGRGDGAKLLCGFAGTKKDGEELLTGQRFLAAKGCKNDGTGRMFLAAKGCKNDGTGRMFLAAKGSRNHGAEAGENTVKAAAAAERIDGAVLGALSEKPPAAFFEPTPAIPHAITLTEKELKNAAEVQENTENELEDDLLSKGVETDPRTEKPQELAKAKIAPVVTEQKAPQYEHMDEAKNNDTTICTSKGLGATSKKFEAVTIPHPLCERATVELVETNRIQDVNSVENWLLEKELESDENYFMRIGTDEEKKVWQGVRPCPNVFGQKSSGRRPASLNTITNKEDIWFLYRQMQSSGSTMDIREIAHPSMKGLSEIIKFLCRNCLSGNEKADKVALQMLCEAVKDIADTEAIGDLPGCIATAVLRSYLGNAESQRFSLQMLILLSRRHRNKLKIIMLGGFRSALWHVSQRHAMMGCRLMASLMDAEAGLMKFIKDGASFELVNLTVKTGNLTAWISGVIEGLRDFPLGRTKFLEAVRSLPSKEVFVQQRLTWCLLDFVEEDERYSLEDTLED